MADKKITELTNITGANLVDADEFVVVDISADETKAITLGEFKNALDTGSGFVRITGDSMTGDLNFGDNDKAVFGAGSDLQIYHDGSNNHSFIKETGTGSLKVLAQDFAVNNPADTANMITAEVGGAITAFYNGGVKLATTSTGVDITGTLTSDGLTSNKNINSTTIPTSRSDYQISVEVDGAHTGDYVGGIAFGDQALSTAQAAILVADRGASAATGLSIATGNSAAITQRMRIDDIGDITFYDTSGNASFVYDESAGSTFNEQGDNKDFRVESDSNDHMLYVDASANKVSVGSGAPQGALNVIYSQNNSSDWWTNTKNALYLQNADSLGQTVVKFNNNTNTRASIVFNTDSSSRFQLFDRTSVQERMGISSGELVINEDSADTDFRVESDSYSSMLKVDAGLNYVGIGNADNLGGQLNIKGTTGIRGQQASGYKIASMIRPTAFGYSVGTYAVTMLGDANTQGTVSIGYDPSSNTSGAFTGTGGEMLFRNEMIFLTPNSADDGYLPHFKLGDSGTVFNDTSKDLDFRVESDGNSHMLFVDAASSYVGVGESAPATTLHASTSDQNIAFFDSSNALGTQFFVRNSTVAVDSSVQIGLAPANNISGVTIKAIAEEDFSVAANRTARLEIETRDNGNFQNRLTLGRSEAVFNDDSDITDFRVESDNEANMINVDAGADTVCIGTANTAIAVQNTLTGVNLVNSGRIYATAPSHHDFNRQTDGEIIRFRSAANTEGSISVSGSTVSYNGFAGRHESSGVPTSTVKGTVVSTIDELDTYLAGPKQGQSRADHAKVKVSDVAGKSCVYGVVDDFDEDGKVNVISVGIGSILVTGSCGKGDLLESNGDGTAKVQSDDIVRSKTIGKVTIGNSDTGVKLVSCVLYCG